MSMYSLCSLHWTHILTPSSKKVDTGRNEPSEGEHASSDGSLCQQCLRPW